MQARGLDMERTTRLGMAHDDAAITPAETCRYDVCALVPSAFQADHSVNVAEIAGGCFAIAEFMGTAHEIESAWDQIFRACLPLSSLQPDDWPCLEICRGRSANAKTGIFRCDLCLPVKTL